MSEQQPKRNQLAGKSLLDIIAECMTLQQPCLQEPESEVGEGWTKLGVIDDPRVRALYSCMASLCDEGSEIAEEHNEAAKLTGHDENSCPKCQRLGVIDSHTDVLKDNIMRACAEAFPQFKEGNIGLFRGWVVASRKPQPRRMPHGIMIIGGGFESLAERCREPGD